MRLSHPTAIIVLFLTTTLAHADNWPQWRGPKNDGTTTEKGLVTTWSNDSNIVWKTPMPGDGSSTPCIWKDNIFITSMVEKDVALICYGTDGKEKWRQVMGSGLIKTRGDEGGNLASASCCTDGERVYAFVGSGKLAAYDFTGKEIWATDIQKNFGEFSIQFGIHWTPVLHKGKLFMQVMHRNAQILVAYDAKLGTQLWNVQRKSDGRGESPDVYSSPFIWEKGENALLISHGNDYCTAHNLSDGSEVWRVTELNPKAKYNSAWRAVSSPLVTPDLIVVPSCKKGVTVGVNPNGAKGDIAPGNAAELWRLAKDTPDVPSPILVDGLVYIMGEVGTMYAYDAKTGEKYYDQRITNMRHRANPVYADGKLFLSGRDGITVVVKTGKTFDKLADNKLADTFTASPAISGGRIYLRGWKYLYAIGLK